MKDSWKDFNWEMKPRLLTEERKIEIIEKVSSTVRIDHLRKKEGTEQSTMAEVFFYTC